MQKANLNRKLPINIIKSLEISDFNKEMLLCWSNFQKTPTNDLEIGNQLIWYNENIMTPNNNTLYYQRLARNHNINYIRDLVVGGKIISTSNGKLYQSKWQLTGIEKIEINSLLNCIPTEWKNINFNRKHVSTIPMEEYIEAEQISLDKINSKAVYKEIIRPITTNPTSEKFFKENWNIEQEEMRELYSVPFTTTIYTKLRSFQFKINHNIFYTNEKLHKIGLSKTALCYMCNETETLSHFFVECQEKKTFWKKVTELLLPYGVQKIDNSEIILGILTENGINNVTNHIILEAKYYLHMCKLEKSIPQFARFKNRLKITESIERQIATKSTKKRLAHEYKWNHLNNFLL